MADQRLAFTSQDPVARVDGGEHKGKLIGIILIDRDRKDKNESDPITLLGQEYWDGKKKSNGKRLSAVDLDVLHKALILRKEPNALHLDLRSIYAEALEQYDNMDRREIALERGCMVPMPSVKGRDTPYIAGPSGAGKSTYVSILISEMRALVPNRPLYVFSRLDSDEVIDIHEPTRVSICSELMREPPDIKDMAGSIVVFDDVDTIPDKKLAEFTRKLRDDLLETGRHENITVISTSHQLTNWNKTRQQINEASSVTVFPGRTPTNHIRRYLKEYVGLELKEIKKILDLRSRWVTICHRVPRYVLHEGGMYLL